MGLCVLLAVIPACFGFEMATAAMAEVRQVNLLLDAIARIESNGNPQAIGDSGRALGVYQIHRSYWRDGTRLLGVNWSYDCARDPVKARQVVRAYLLHYGRGRSLLEKARIHNGGPRGYQKKATLRYAHKIAKVLGQNAEVS
jgi:hypothetical protein